MLVGNTVELVTAEAIFSRRILEDRWRSAMGDMESDISALWSHFTRD